MRRARPLRKRGVACIIRALGNAVALLTNAAAFLFKLLTVGSNGGEKPAVTCLSDAPPDFRLTTADVSIMRLFPSGS